MPNALGQAAVEKCRNCRYGQYRPTNRTPERRVAYDVEAIKCSEGIFGFPTQGDYGYRHHKGPHLLPADFTFWLWTGSLMRRDSKTRDIILRCAWWEKKGALF